MKHHLRLFLATAVTTGFFSIDNVYAFSAAAPSSAHSVKSASFASTLDDEDDWAIVPKFVDVGNHFEAAGCDPYPGGIERLKMDLDHAVTYGIHTLSKMKNSARKKDARKFKKFLESSKDAVRIYCHPKLTASQILEFSEERVNDAVAWTYKKGHPLFPAIGIDLEKLESDPFSNYSILLHEMVHLLGYDHTSGVDVSYLLPLCTFGANSEIKETACSLLDSEGLDWKSPEYFVPFTQIMIHYSRGHVALEASFAATIQALPYDVRTINAVSTVLNATLPGLGRIFNFEGHSASSSTLSSRGEIFNFINGAFLAGLNDDSEEMDRRVDLMIAQRKEICRQLNSLEQIEVQLAFRLITDFQVKVISQKLNIFSNQLLGQQKISTSDRREMSAAIPQLQEKVLQLAQRKKFAETFTSFCQ
jgi:hypothetical protein